ncbi:proctolin receptor [Musca autumnalis]|uniref:proctolin receptor n=1 Tax=Musca autumnalis TaxID=221902 RepID=UPI003CF2B36A
MVHISDETVNEVRHVVQKILVPCIFVIGVLGNSVSVYVLTRKRMRCTTNIYLTALAITDIFFLTMGLLLSFQHYQYIHLHVKLYWELYGTFTWLCDACAYISIYIAVCFTIERFIAIRYPLKRQTFCTESLAKKVIAGVTIFCVLSTMSTFFEHEASVEYQLLDSEGKPCTLNDTSPTHISLAMENGVSFLNSIEGSGGNSDADVIMATTSEDVMVNHLKRSLPQQENEAFPSIVNIPSPEAVLSSSSMASSQNQSEILPIDVLQSCKNVTYYVDGPGILGQNDEYDKIWSYVSLIVYVLLPLGVLATFNCFLVVMVKRSNTLRRKMTNASSMRKPKDRPSTTSVSQENRVTITLIAVVVCFIICQLPWAAYLIVRLQNPGLDFNLQRVLGNVFNFLSALNAAANFFLYCVLSDKYRKTVRELITGRSGRHERGTLTSTSLMFHNTSRCSYRPAPSGHPGIK